MQSYCPYSNIHADQLYPNMLIVGGMNDPRVAYFEPAKWTAKLRANALWSLNQAVVTSPEGSTAPAQVTREGDRLLMLKIQEAGHSGSSGQYSHLEDLAFEYAFLISSLGAQFKPISSGGAGLNGVDYDMYWQELANQEDEEELYEDEPEESSELKRTPLQRFSDFLSRRGSRNHEKKKSLVPSSPKVSKRDGRRRVSQKAHSRSNSLSSVKRALGIRSSRDDGAVTETPEHDGATEAGETLSPLVTVASRKSPTTTPTGSKASLRHPLHSQDEASGRVQSSGRFYTFLSKFF
jgi:hypothetical protein